jgi:hypothetical protein
MALIKEIGDRRSRFSHDRLFEKSSYQPIFCEVGSATVSRFPSDPFCFLVYNDARTSLAPKVGPPDLFSTTIFELEQ